jgi:hypothetical protein
MVCLARIEILGKLPAAAVATHQRASARWPDGVCGAGAGGHPGVPAAMKPPGLPRPACRCLAAGEPTARQKLPESWPTEAPAATVAGGDGRKRSTKY